MVKSVLVAYGQKSIFSVWLKLISYVWLKHIGYVWLKSIGSIWFKRNGSSFACEKKIRSNHAYAANTRSSYILVKRSTPLFFSYGIYLMT